MPKGGLNLGSDYYRRLDAACAAARTANVEAEPHMREWARVHHDRSRPAPPPPNREGRRRVLSQLRRARRHQHRG